jgi:amino acid adenylation domain-containing protein
VFSRLQELFFSSVKNSGARIAIEELSGNSISYSELEKSVRQNADFFSAYKIGKGCRVAVMASKSIETISTLLAILETGAAYIPIDPEIPKERLQQILRNLDPHAFIALPENFPSGIPCQFQSITASGKLGIAFLAAENHTDNLACILYTSGSTGAPKGVCITHENAIAFVDWCLRTFAVNQNDRFSSIAPLHFDLSVFDLYAALGCGGTIILFDEATTKNPRKLGELLAKKNISVCYATPSLLSLLLNFGKIDLLDFSKLKRVLFAGEVFPVLHLHALMKRWKNSNFFNLYGPTETNVCTHYEIPKPIDESRDEPYPIGKICDHLEGKITSDGELLIAGKNVTVGYWKRLDLNVSAFVEYEEKRFYKTGDRIEKDKDGNLIFCGRIDRMIKKRGYRIEPEEVESALMRHPDVLEAAVVEGKDGDGYSLIKAFLALRKDAEESVIAIKQHCLEILPSYMIPERIIFMETLPKTTSGKIDLKILSEK